IGRDTTQIFVLHGLVIQAILSHLFGRSLKFWHATPIVNAALARIAWNNDSCELVSLNEERK
ncbi:MAG: histidine phosphatase family protein, partial [Pseudomonadota bacterium]